MKAGKIVLQLGAATLLTASAAHAQDAAQAPAEENLPAVEVIQETPQQKASRAKKKAAPASPLAKTTVQTPPAATANEAPAAAAASQSTGTLSTAKIPSAVSTVTDADVDQEGTGQIQQVLQQTVPGIIISDAAGNPLRAEVSYRGFDASPVSGRSQGLAVYQNGIRINEAFGDTVQWDAIPSNAISSISVVSNNPSFGLNAVGGAMSITMKDGFTYQGGELDVMFGSFGRRQVGVQAGGAVGNASAYVAVEGMEEDGFRNFSDSEVKRFYGDIGLRGSMAEVHLSLTASDNSFGATAAAPIELLEESWKNTFTSPQTSDVEVFMPTLSATVKATDTTTVSGAAYYRRFKSRVVDGNVTEISECTGVKGPVGTLCLDPGADEEPVLDLNGAAIDEDIAAEDRLGTIDRLQTDSWSWGTALEGVNKDKLFNRPNQFILGASFDQGRSKYRTSSEIGEIQQQYVVTGTGTFIGEPDEISPRNLIAENTYFGAYFSNALDVTDRFTLTLGGRYNYAKIKMRDLTGDFDGLNATNTFERFNPMAGGTYKVLPGLTLYGGYSESNRAPTPAELGCAEPANPCLIESFLTDDPPLNQVVGRTAEVGLRGETNMNGGRLSWAGGVFGTLASDDILPIINDAGRIYFVNAGDTLRQGVELEARFDTSKWSVYGSYAFVDATLDDCSQPDVQGQCAFLSEGDRLPGIPRHRFKAGIQYWLTSKWKVGSDFLAVGDSPYFPNEVSRDDGLNAFLPGYTRFDLNTSYDVTDNIQVYGLVKNLFNRKYGLYGTYFEADEVSEVNEALGGQELTDSRTMSPAQPFAAYGGVKIKY